ncbi:CPBP family intramembrane glutamic endopeptidase [Lactiplantibacillus daowaiensis]|uniref:CPBP family intramembrane glutamic endopeptidase n=1 Tax=Lactiplantibacillus daowaiensis TaxID=2559918 RepID=A0ABW1S284_9LACO|nr:CPBP family intramembrane glutamic endopeptidase [Lactiplantibacillus daowaiensis]
MTRKKINVGWQSYIILLVIWSGVTPVIHGWLPLHLHGWPFDLTTVLAKGILWSALTWWYLTHYRSQLADTPHRLWHWRLPGTFWLSLVTIVVIQGIGQLWRPTPFALTPDLWTKENGQVINVMLAAGVFEEWFFRGWLTNYLSQRKTTFWQVNLAQAVAFQVIHFPLYLVNGYTPLVWLANIACVLPLGLLFGWNYHRSHNIWPSILLHITWNSLVFLLN